MTDKLMNDEYVKSKAPTCVIIICAGFMMIIQTFAAGLAVIGYDDVIRAGAKAKEAQILQRASDKECQVPDINLMQRINALEDKQEQLIIDNDSLKLLSHRASQ